MRALVLITFVAACSFQAGSVGSNPSSDARRDVDAVVVTADSSVDSYGPSGGCSDADSDGICDSQTWTCGAMPPPPINPTYLGGGFSNVTDANLGGNGAFLVAVAGATIQLVYDYGIEVPCGGGDATCSAQIELGLMPSGRQGCLFDGTVNNNGFEYEVNVTTMVTVPTTPGSYELRANLGMNPDCASGGNAWSGGPPGPADTFAFVCVP